MEARLAIEQPKRMRQPGREHATPRHASWPAILHSFYQNLRGNGLRAASAQMHRSVRSIFGQHRKTRIWSTPIEIDPNTIGMMIAVDKTEMPFVESY